eukprot:366232-Chlamydomonas_euryale.AAC.20
MTSCRSARRSMGASSLGMGGVTEVVVGVAAACLGARRGQGHHSGLHMQRMRAEASAWGPRPQMPTHAWGLRPPQRFA